MCGIAGWIGPEAGWNAETFREGLRQRGPDGSAIRRGTNATLVHTRLAILDLSDSGRQPMEWGREVEGRGSRVGCDGPGAAIVFNGEIYNFRDLRADLEEKGEEFESESDTEVLLRLLAIEGTACLPRLAGMFAFCLVNESEGDALLARDAYGIKPLYYRLDGRTLAFSSEARLLHREGDELDAEALQDYFLWGSLGEAETPLRPVRQVPAGHFLRYAGATGEIRLERWHATPGRNEISIPHPTREAAVNATRLALEESIGRHLVSDVPVGIFLSGGIDSTAVLALVRQRLGPDADLRTFSIGFEDPAYDESSIARRTAGHFGARHTEWRMTSEDGAREIPAFLKAMDLPTIDGFNTWCVSKLARREGIKVVLSGLGGDEWFAGYGSFRQVPRFHSLHRRLGPARALVSRLLRLAPEGSRWRRLASFLRGKGGWLAAFHVQRGIFTAEESARLTARMTGRAPGAVEWNRGTAPFPGTPEEIVGDLELTRYMRNQLLRDSDVFSMAHGLELRVPLVDVRLAETLLALPPEVRLEAGKGLLLEAVPEIPDWVRNQAKRGFRFPFQEWMEGDFAEMLAEAKRESPVALKTWYRTWAAAAATQWIRRLSGAPNRT